MHERLARETPTTRGLARLPFDGREYRRPELACVPHHALVMAVALAALALVLGAALGGAL
jgi:hypothetical protein